MLNLKDLPDAAVLKKFADRYPQAEIDSVIQFLTILKVGSDLSDVLNGYLAQHGLLQSRWWILVLLMREEDLTAMPSALATKAGVRKATMTGLIDGLAREGLVIRLQNGVDKRTSAVKLTKAGQAKLDAVMPDYYNWVKQLMGVIPSEQRELLIQQLLLLKNESQHLR
jgi:DNA-binding MarR family transcriptional regulator